MSRREGFYEKYIKRTQDLVISFVMLILLSPLFLIIGILVRTKLGSPVLFTQYRPGKNERIYKMYKFRTMTNEKDKDGNLLPDSVRLTRFGRLLRSTSLDELPELINIVRGDMAIIGPRPQLVRDMVFMTLEQRQRHTVLPGLTGWAQVNGRNNITWEEKLDLDLKYIKKISFYIDLKILILTMKRVIKKEDISTDGMDTAEDLGDYLLRLGKVNHYEYEQKQKIGRELLGNR